MTNEEFQLLVLQELKELKEGQKALEAGQKAANERLDNIESRTERSENRLNEQHDLLHAILHNQEFTSAEIIALKTTTANARAVTEIIENVQDIQAGLDILNNRLFAQERAMLKLAK